MNLIDLRKKYCAEGTHDFPRRNKRQRGWNIEGITQKEVDVFITRVVLPNPRSPDAFCHAHRRRRNLVKEINFTKCSRQCGARKETSKFGSACYYCSSNIVRELKQFVQFLTLPTPAVLSLLQPDILPEKEKSELVLT